MAENRLTCFLPFSRAIKVLNQRLIWLILSATKHSQKERYILLWGTFWRIDRIFHKRQEHPGWVCKNGLLCSFSFAWHPAQCQTQSRRPKYVCWTNWQVIHSSIDSYYNNKGKYLLGHNTVMNLFKVRKECPLASFLCEWEDEASLMVPKIYFLPLGWQQDHLKCFLLEIFRAG